MRAEAVEQLDSAAENLRRAMESGDADRINGAAALLEQAIAAVRAIGAWQSDPAIRKRLRDLLPRLDSDQMLARLLGDLTGRQLDLLAERATVTAPATYSRPR